VAKNKEYELAIKIAGEVERSFYESTKLTKKELRNIAKQSLETAKAAESMYGMNFEELNKSLKEMDPVFSHLEQVSEAAFGVIKKGAVMSAAAIAAVTTASMAVGANFEEQMSAVQAVSMSSEEDMLRLNEKAKELGASTKFSATEVGQGFEYMAMAGWKTEEMLDGIGGVLNLAAASGEDLGEVSDIVTDAMTAFGLGADQAGRFADVLAMASSNANTNVSMMGETFKYVAPVAGTMGYSIEDTAVAIGLMANSGIKASQAGTALRSMFSRLSTQPKEVQKAMDVLKLSLTDQDGNMKSFMEIMQDMRAGFAGMSELDQADIAAKLGGQEAMSGILAMVNASSEDFDKLTTAINNSTGAAEKMAEIRLDNLKGDMTILRSAAEGFGIELFENLNGPAREIVQFGTEFIGDMTKEISSKVPTARRNILDFADSMQKLQGPVLSVGGWFLDNPGAITGPVVGIGSALAAYKVASGVSSLAAALGALNPAGIAILGLGGVAGVITGISTSVKKASAEAKKANLAAHFGSISLSLEDLQAAASNVVRSQELDKVRESIDALNEVEGIADDIRETTEELNRMNWKVSVGMELTETEQEAYREQIENYIGSTQEYLAERQYAVNLAVGVLTDDDIEGRDIVAKVNQFYKGKMDELAGLGTQLNETITNAFNDGLLDIDEIAEITKLQSQMANIQNSLTGAEYDANIELLHTKYSVGDLDAESFRNLQAELQEQTAAASADYEKSFVLSVSNADVMRQEGDIGQDEYDSMVAEFRKNYLENVGNLQAKAANFQAQAIRSQYADETGTIDLTGKIGEATQYTLDYVNATGNAVLGFDADAIYDQMDIGLDKATKAAISELWEDLSPQLEQMIRTAEEYRAAGEAIPDALAAGINDTAAIGALIGDSTAIYTLMGETARSSEEYSALLADMLDQGTYIPEQIAAGIRSNRQVVIDAINETMQTAVGMADSRGIPGTGKTGSIPVGAHADGGIFDRPHLAWIAEAGYKEAAIPIDGSKNAIDLWLKTGELLGMDGLTGGESPIAGDVEEMAYSGTGGMELHIDNSRVITINGNASKEDIEEALDNDADEFDRKMQEWMARNRRLKFV